MKFLDIEKPSFFVQSKFGSLQSQPEFEHTAFLFWINWCIIQKQLRQTSQQQSC